jgi:hypothetical protein
MLTVKYISEFGFERVFSAIEVSTRGREYPEVQSLAGLNILDDGRPNFVVECKRGPMEVETVRDGQVFIMNDNGKTVANYDLRYASAQQATKLADVHKYQSGLNARRMPGVLGDQKVDERTPL